MFEQLDLLLEALPEALELLLLLGPDLLRGHLEVDVLLLLRLVHLLLLLIAHVLEVILKVLDHDSLFLLEPLVLEKKQEK